MEDEAHNEQTEKYKVLHFLRNVCSLVLAELFAKELKSSKFIQESLQRDRKGAVNKTLYEALKDLKLGRRIADVKKCRGKIWERASASGTCQANNIEENKEILQQLQVKELLKEGEAQEAVTKLGRLNVKFLLCLLINNVLGFPHSTRVREALQKLRELSRSNIYQTKDKKLLIKLWEETEHLHTYLGRDTSNFQEQKKLYYFPLNSCDPILKDVQQEISENHQHHNHHHHYHHHQTHFTIESKHLGEYYNEGETIENLEEFLIQKQVNSCQEPRPIVMCGEPGSGKSFILNNLIHTISKKLAFRDFLMVVKVHHGNTTSKEEFWKKVFSHLISLSPKAAEKYGCKNVTKVLSRYTNKFLFLMDHNLRDTTELYHLIPYLDCGTWVLSYQGVPEPSTDIHVLKVTPLSEEQVHQVLQGIAMPQEDRKLVFQLYKKCDYKDLIQTPDMMHIFAEICLEKRSCVPFYMLIQHYIYEKVDRTEENEAKLVELGKRAFDTIEKNQKYYQGKLLDNLDSVSFPFFEHDSLKGYFFKYRIIEDYLAAKYTVTHPKEACKSWLSQAITFKTVFHIACALWSEQGNGIQTNLHFIKGYLEKLFENDGSQKRRGKKRKLNDSNENVQDIATNQNIFKRWFLLSKIAKDNENNQDILCFLADLLTRCNIWLFKHTSLTENLIKCLSLVLRHVKLNKELTIKMESGTNIEILNQLWSMLSSHPQLLSKTSVHLVICYTESSVAKYAHLLAEFCATIYSTTAPFHITQYTGPLLCSKTPQLFECSAMKELNMLDVFICDLTSLSKVLEQKQNLSNITVRLRLKAVEPEIIKPLKIKISSSLPPVLTISYFKGLQTLLDSFEQPESLCSLKIYEVYVHKDFRLDLTRFTKLEFLSVKFDHKGNEKEISLMPLEKWTSHLVKHLHLPTHVERLLMGNLPFFDDSTASDLASYFKKLTFQRLILLDTKFSISKFWLILQSIVTSSSIADIDESRVVKCRRLEKEEREAKRRNKPEGKELIITSEAELFTNLQASTKNWEDAYYIFVSIVKKVYSCPILSINYSGSDTVIRKDMCGDLFVHCPLPFLDDEMAQHPERLPELDPLLEVMALAQVICLNYTHLSHEGALHMLEYLKRNMGNYESKEPYRLTIFSCLLSICSKSVDEVKHNSLLREIKNYDKLQQFNFRCTCKVGCHFLKKAIDGSTYFNNLLLGYQ